MGGREVGKYKALTIGDEIRALKRMIIFISQAIDVPENCKPPVGFIEYVKGELKDVGTMQYKLEEPEEFVEKKIKKELF